MTDVTGQDKVTGQDFFFSCPLYFFPHSFSSSYFLPLLHYLISILLFAFASVWGNHSCMSSPCSIVILNGTCYFRALILLCGDVPAIQQLNYKQTTISWREVIYHTAKNVYFLSYLHRCTTSVFPQPGPSNHAAGFFLILSYFYGFLILRSEQLTSTYCVARLQVADSRRPMDVYMFAHTYACISTSVNEYALVSVSCEQPEISMCWNYVSGITIGSRGPNCLS